MSDLTTSIIVIACTGLVVGLVFLLARKRKQSNEQALEAYCQDNGYSYKSVREPLRVERSVEGASFKLISSMAAHYLNENSASTEWEKSTQITAQGAQDAPSFVLGSVPAASNWDILPEWTKKAVIGKLMSESGIQLNPESAQYFPTTGKSAFLLFEQTPGASRNAMQQLLPLLDDWPTQFNLLIHSSPKEIRIHVGNCFIQDVALLDQLIRLAQL